MTTVPTDRRATTRPLAETAVVSVSGVLLIASLLGPAWLVMPANPAAGTPAAAVSFTDLSAATENSPSTVQSFFFGWPAWVLFGALIFASAAVVYTGNRFIAACTAAATLVVAMVSVLAIKGPLTWSQTIDSLPNLRLGGYLMLTGLLIVVAFNGYKASRSSAAS